MKIKIKEKDIKKNKNIIFIVGGIVLIVLLYFIASPYQQCVRGYMNLNYDKEKMKKFYSKAGLKKQKAYIKSKAQIACRR